MSEDARAHLARRLAEAEYLDERDSRRPEHKEPGISCNIVKAETGLLGDLPPDVAVEIDTAADNVLPDRARRTESRCRRHQRYGHSSRPTRTHHRGIATLPSRSTRGRPCRESPSRAKR